MNDKPNTHPTGALPGVFVHCPDLPPHKGPPVQPYQGDLFNKMYQGQPKAVFSSPNRPPERSSTTELNDWLMQRGGYQGRRREKYPTVPEYLMQRALAKPGSVDLNTWIAAMR